MLAALIVVIALVALLVGWAAIVSAKAEQLVPADGELVTIGDSCIHYLDLGPKDAPAIVMIHGLLGQMRNFTYALAPAMARDHRVIVIDRPGWGYSRSRPHPDIAGQAELVAGLIDRLELTRPWLVGHSMGGAVSLAVALAHPDKIAGLALIAPYTQPVSTPPEPFKGLVVPTALRGPIAWTLAVPIGMATAGAKGAAVFHPDPAPADFPTRGGAALGVRPKSFLAGSAEMGFAEAAMVQQAPGYPEIAVPVAILYGREDAILDPGLHGAETAAAIPGATVDVIEGGHMLLVTHPTETEAWLRRVIA